MVHISHPYLTLLTADASHTRSPFHAHGSHFTHTHTHTHGPHFTHKVPTSHTQGQHFTYTRSTPYTHSPTFTHTVHTSHKRSPLHILTVHTSHPRTPLHIHTVPTSHPTVYHSVILQLSITLLHHYLHKHRFNICVVCYSVRMDHHMFVCMYVMYIICMCQQFACQHDTLQGTNSVTAVPVRNLHSQFLLQHSTAQHSTFHCKLFTVPQTSPQLCRQQCAVLPVNSHIPPLSATVGSCSPSAAPNGVLRGFHARD